MGIGPHIKYVGLCGVNKYKLGIFISMQFNLDFDS